MAVKKTTHVTRPQMTKHLKAVLSKEKPLSFFLVRPKYWGGLLFMGISWFVAKLPLSIQLVLAKGFAWLLLKLASSRKNITEINLKLCFPEKSQEEREALLKRNFLMSALAVIEIASCWFSDLSSRKKHTKLIGLENLEKAQAEGKGVILLIFHFTSMEIGGSILGHYFDFNAMYKPNKKNLLAETFMRKGRLKHIHGLLTQDDARATIKALKNGEIVWYATDQNYGNKKGTFVPFFGTKASTVTAITKFAKMTGAKIVPYTHKRSDDLKSLELELHPAWDDFPGESPEKDAERINLFLENFLKENPENYLWLHQRFRTRPEGEPLIYPAKN